MTVSLDWRACTDYDDFIAQASGTAIVYAFYFGDVLTYVGKSSAASSLIRRYGVSYRHLFHAYRMWTAVVPEYADLDSVECCLIRDLNPLLNRRRRAPAFDYGVNGPHAANVNAGRAQDDAGKRERIQPGESPDDTRDGARDETMKICRLSDMTHRCPQHFPKLILEHRVGECPTTPGRRVCALDEKKE